MYASGKRSSDVIRVKNLNLHVLFTIEHLKSHVNSMLVLIILYKLDTVLRDYFYKTVKFML